MAVGVGGLSSIMGLVETGDVVLYCPLNALGETLTNPNTRYIMQQSPIKPPASEIVDIVLSRY